MDNYPFTIVARDYYKVLHNYTFSEAMGLAACAYGAVLIYDNGEWIIWSINKEVVQPSLPAPSFDHWE